MLTSFLVHISSFAPLLGVLLILATISLIVYVRWHPRQPYGTRDLHDDKGGVLEEALGLASSGEKLQALFPANEQCISRGDWVETLHTYVHDNCWGKRYNTLVFNTAVERYFLPEGVIRQFTINYDSCKENGTIEYEVTVFRKGTLINLGDGGYINWCFDGNYERFGKTVNFFEGEEGQS